MPNDPQKPWYRQFWPWFIIALPAAVVVAGFTTLFIALNNPHSMVDDAYYEEGLAINQRLGQDREAARLQMQARVFFDSADQQVRVELQGEDQPDRVQLLLMHPVSEAFDQQLDMEPGQPGSYVASYQPPTQTNYYLRLLPPDENWRLNGEVDFRFGNQVLLVSQ